MVSASVVETEPNRVPAERRGEDPRYTAAVIPTNALDCLMQIAEQRQVDTAPWFAGLGLTRQHLQDPGVRVSYRQASVIIHRAQQALAQPALGLAVGSCQNIGTFGVLGLAMMTARTFGEAMQLGIENHQVAGSLMDVEFDVLDAHSAAMNATPRFVDPAILPFLCEELFGSSLVVSRGLLGAEFSPLRMEFTYPAPSYIEQYHALFQCELYFGMPHNRAVLHSDWMQRELITHHPVSAQQALDLCRERLASITGARGEITVTVERLLRSRLHENPSVREIAGSLHLTERSLRRQLTSCGQVFSRIHDRIRTERALELLRIGRLTIAEIGSAVGFSDAREFRRAFKRWTGVAPIVMRAVR